MLLKELRFIETDTYEAWVKKCCGWEWGKRALVVEQPLADVAELLLLHDGAHRHAVVPFLRKLSLIHI